MSVVLNTNEQSTRIRSIYNRNVGQMNAAMTRLATTRKINSAKDGAANWAISEKMRERIRANDQANQNVQNDTALLKTAQDGYSNTLDILQTLKERAINSANDANVSSDRTKIKEEVKQLVAQIDDNAAKVKFNGRQLLNGASETAATTSTSSTAAATKSATTTASGANIVTATEPQGTHSVYSFSGMYTYDSTNDRYVEIDSSITSTSAASINLVDIRDKDGNYLFANGDKITVSWNDNGEAKEANLTVIGTGQTAANGTTPLTASTLKDFTDLFTASTDGAKSFSSSSWFMNADTAIGTGTVQTPYGDDVKTTDKGFYLIAKDSTHKITDLAISVSRSDGTSADRVAATQSTLEPTGILQNAGTDFSKGSNQVYTIEGSVSGDIVFGDLGDQTKWLDLKHVGSSYTGTDGKNYVYSSHLATATTSETDTITMTINDKSISFTAGSTIETVNKLLEANDIDVRLHMAKVDEVLNYDGEDVTKGDSTSTATYKAAKAGLHFIAGEGTVITSLKITGGTTSGNTDFVITTGSTNVLDSSTSKSKYAESLGVDDDFLNSNSSTTSSSSSTSESGLPQGDALQFFVGGEANFGINFTFGKANVENLFGMTGDKFAKMFETKETAEEALTAIDDAINKTLVEQTRLGALEARLGYTSDNLTSMNTNLESGISAYRDADIAKEMTDYMKYSVLQQSSQYMLAQATQNPFSVLQLLQP